MGICFYCGEPTGEIALLGALKGDVEAPKYTILNYTPCDKCKEQISKGVTVIESGYATDGRPPISKDSTGAKVYPTGRWCVLNKEPAIKMFGLNENTRTICVDNEIYESLMKAIPNDTEDNSND